MKKISVKARNKLILDNLGLVGYVARKWLGSIGFDEAYQQGVLGLVKAAEGFDPKRGIKFNTYAMPWIRQFIYRYWLSTKCIVHIPEYLHNPKRKFTNPEVVYIDNPYIKSMGIELQSDEESKHGLINLEVWHLLSTLSEREKYILKEWSKGRTLESISKKYDLSRERIRQIKEAALNKIRKQLKKELA